MTQHLTLLGLALLAFPAAVSAAPTIGTPSTESLASSRPLYTWTMPAGEEVSAIRVSRSASTTPEGETFDEDLETGDALDGTDTAWQSTTRTPAGTYWWQLAWHTTDYTTTGYTTPSQFMIPAYVRGVSVSMKQYRHSADHATVAFTANTRTAKVKCRLSSGNKTLRSRSVTVSILQVGAKTTEQCDPLSIPKAYAGKRVRITATVTAGGKTATATRVVTALAS